MHDTGLTEIMESAFSGVSKMLSWKKIPQYMRALRIVSTEILWPVFERQEVVGMNSLLTILSDLSKESRVSKCWIANLIKPVLVMMKYIRAERESDFALHQVVREMMVMFFAANHVNYARYGLYYLRSLDSMNEDVRQHFINGEHTFHHKSGYWNGIWSDRRPNLVLNS